MEYKRKMRPLRVRMLDGTVKTVLVDDSQVVANLMVVICTKIGELIFSPIVLSLLNLLVILKTYWFKLSHKTFLIFLSA